VPFTLYSTDNFDAADRLLADAQVADLRLRMQAGPTLCDRGGRADRWTRHLINLAREAAMWEQQLVMSRTAAIGSSIDSSGESRATTGGDAAGQSVPSDSPSLCKQRIHTRRKWIQEQFPKLAEERDSGQKPVYPTEEAIIGYLRKNLRVSPPTIKSDLRWLRKQELLPPWPRRRRQLTNTMHLINPTRSDD
jgi:hypothetical protein